MKYALLILAVAVAMGPLAQAQSAHELLQEAAYQERALGDLKRANELYSMILERHSTENREVAAQSLYQLAVNEQTQGHLDAARQALRRLVAEFPEQERLVAEAAAHGVLPGSGPDVKTRVVWDMGDYTGIGVEPSPDGRYISFGRGPSGNLGIKDLETGEINLLTTGATWDLPRHFADQSSWSRDGKQIAFLWWEGDEGARLKVVDVETGVVRTLVEHYVWPLAWTSDGRILGMRNISGDPDLVFISSSDGATEVVFETPEGTGVIADLSPDGRWLVCTLLSRVDENQDMFLLSATGGDPIPLAVHPAQDRRPYWGPDGRMVYFASDRSGSDALWRVPVSDGKQSGQPEVVFGDMRNGYAAGFDQAGRLFVFRAETESSGNLYTVSLGPTGTASTSASVRMPLFGIGYNAGASFSDDGRYLSYVSQRPASRVVVRDLTTGREVEHDLPEFSLLTNGSDKPRWRPGTHDLLVATNLGLRVIDAVSGDVLASIYMGDLNMRSPHWSADGSAIWGRIGASIGYVSMDDAGGADFLPTWEAPPATAWRMEGDGACDGPAVHPTDGTLAYACGDVIYRLNPETGEHDEWWRFPEGEYTGAREVPGTLDFTPDGAALLFQRSRKSDEVQIWRLPVGDSEPEPVTDWIPRGWGFEMHPSGEQAVYTVLDGARNEMWVLEGLE